MSKAKIFLVKIEGDGAARAWTATKEFEVEIPIDSCAGTDQEWHIIGGVWITEEEDE